MYVDLSLRCPHQALPERRKTERQENTSVLVMPFQTATLTRREDQSGIVLSRLVTFLSSNTGRIQRLVPFQRPVLEYINLRLSNEIRNVKRSRSEDQCL